MTLYAAAICFVFWPAWLLKLRQWLKCNNQCGGRLVCVRVPTCTCGLCLRSPACHINQTRGLSVIILTHSGFSESLLWDYRAIWCWVDCAVIVIIIIIIIIIHHSAICDLQYISFTFIKWTVCTSVIQRKCMSRQNKQGCIPETRQAKKRLVHFLKCVLWSINLTWNIWLEIHSHCNTCWIFLISTKDWGKAPKRPSLIIRDFLYPSCLSTKCLWEHANCGDTCFGLSLFVFPPLYVPTAGLLELLRWALCVDS